MNTAPSSIRGRPMEPDLSARILKTTLRLLSRSGFRDFRLDDVAALCATSKQAFYRRWPSKSHLAAAAVIDGLARANAVLPDSESAIADLTKVLDNVLKAWQSTPLGGALRALLAERNNKQLAACLRKADTARREVLRAILRRAEQGKEIRPIADVEQAIDTLLGGAWVRYLIAGRVSKDYASKAVAMWLSGAR